MSEERLGLPGVWRYEPLTTNPDPESKENPTHSQHAYLGAMVTDTASQFCKHSLTV